MSHIYKHVHIYIYIYIIYSYIFISFFGMFDSTIESGLQRVYVELWTMLKDHVMLTQCFVYEYSKQKREKNWGRHAEEDFFSEWWWEPEEEWFWPFESVSKLKPEKKYEISGMGAGGGEWKYFRMVGGETHLCISYLILLIW